MTKRLLKQLSYNIFKILGKFKTTQFSSFFIALGYAIKNEAFFNTNGADYLIWEDRLDMHKHIAKSIVGSDKEIQYLEFGVFKGQTIQTWLESNNHPNSVFVGFDTFDGLPEDWGNVKKGTFSTGGNIPKIADNRCGFYVGLIQDSLPTFVTKISKGKRKVIHIDVDLYNASLIVLITLHPFLEQGDLIIFDDFFTLTKAKFEFRAFLDYLSLYPIKFLPLINCRNGHFVMMVEKSSK